jgi:hypothetical protein
MKIGWDAVVLPSIQEPRRQSAFFRVRDRHSIRSVRFEEKIINSWKRTLHH